MYKGDVYLKIPGIGRVIKIWDEVFFKLRVYVDGLVIRKKVLYKSSNCIEKYLDVFVEVLEIHISVSFDLYVGE